MRSFKFLLKGWPTSASHSKMSNYPTSDGDLYSGRRRPGDTKNGAGWLQKHLPDVSRLAKFTVVGISGVFVNMGAYTYLIGSGIQPAYASAVSVEASILSNFALNDLWTFRDRRSGKVVIRLLLFHLSRLAGAIANVATVALLTALGLDPIMSNMLGIILGVAVNFYTSDRVVWRVG
jgi:dolichol-phosphate mannosyltransferase